MRHAVTKANGCREGAIRKFCRPLEHFFYSFTAEQVASSMLLSHCAAYREL